MANIYYKIQFKTELEGLNLELRRSKGKGLLIPKKFFFRKNKVTKKVELDITFFKTLKSFNKKIILYENYQGKRPSLINPNKIKEEEDKKIYFKKFNNFKNFCNEKELESFFLKEIEDYQKIIKHSKIFTSGGPKSGIEKRLFGKSDRFEISNFIIPFLPQIPSNYENKNKFFEDLYKFNQKAHNIIEKLLAKYSSKYHLKDQIYMISLCLDDISKGKYSFDKIRKILEPYNNIGLWIIEFNELNASKKKIENYRDTLSKIYNHDSCLFIYYSGVYSSRLIEKINPKIRNIIRISGYPGLNVNIPSRVTRTKRFYYQGSGNFYNASSFSKNFLISHSSLTYNCDCLSCKEFNIKDYKKVYDLYFQDPTDVAEYQRYVGRALKTKTKKLKTKQRFFLMRHNFHNLDHHLHMNAIDFKKLVFQSTFCLNNWNKYI